MAKKYVFFQTALLFWLIATGVSYANAPLNANYSIEGCESCNLPAPTEFVVTASSDESIYLNWIPVSPTSTHTIVVYTQTSQNSSWTPVKTYPNVPGATFAVPNDNYDLANLQFSIATNCANGEASGQLTFAKPPLGYILELIVGGRTPTNLHQESNCQPFKINPESWFGFEIRYNKGLNPPHNLFEVTNNFDIIEVSRVIDNNVVAGTEDHDYPKFPFGSIQFYVNQFLTFKITENSYDDAGVVKITHTSSGNDDFIKICKFDPLKWNNDYDLIIYSGTIPKPSSGLTPQILADRTNTQSDPSDNWLVQNPFSQSLEFNLPYHSSPTLVNVLDMHCNLVLREEFDEIQGKISLPTINLAPGFYVVQVISNGVSKCRSVLKL